MKRVMTILAYGMTIVFLSVSLADAQWVQTNGPGGGRVSVLAVMGTSLYLGTPNGVFVTTENAATWKPANSGLPFHFNVSCMGVSGPNILAASDRKGVYYSPNGGTSWSPVTTGLPGSYSVLCFTSLGPDLFAGLEDGGLLVSKDNGINWTRAGTKWPSGTEFFCLASIGARLFAGTRKGVFCSKDNSASWEAASSGLPKDSFIFCLTAIGTTLFAGTGSGIYLSSDNGASWIKETSGLPRSVSVGCLTAIGSSVFAGTSKGIFRASDDGRNWRSASSGLPTNTFVNVIIPLGSVLFAGLGAFAENAGLFMSLDSGASWKPMNSGPPNSQVTSIAIIGQTIFACVRKNEEGYLREDGFLSIDEGASWSPVAARFPGVKWIGRVARIGQHLFAPTDNGVIYSIDDGFSWNPVNTGLPARSRISDLAVSGSTLFACTSDRVFKTDNYGLKWTVFSWVRPGEIFWDLFVFGDHLFVRTFNGIFSSVKKDATWASLGRVPRGFPFPSKGIWSVGENLYVENNEGSFVSTDSGSSWKKFPSEVVPAACLGVSGTTILLGFDTKGPSLYYSNDNGRTWNPAGIEIYGGFVASEKCLLVGTYDMGVWRLPLSSLTPTSIR